MMRWLGCLLAMSTTLALADARVAYGAVFNVASGDEAGLVAAIDAANANGEADTINVAAGTYSLSTAETAFTALPEITSAIAIVGAGAATTILDVTAQPLRIFRVTDAGVLHLEGLTLSHGNLGFSGEFGGAIWSTGAVRIASCTLSHNSTAALLGAAIFQSLPGSLVIEDSLITANSGGTVVFASGRIEIRRSELSGNGSSVLRWDGYAERAIIEDTTIQSNAFGVRVALVPDQSAIFLMTRSLIDDNGTGLSLEGEELSAFITDSTISNNTVTTGNGGGLYVSGGARVVVRNSTISGNSSSGNGGGIAVVGGLFYDDEDLTIENSTISGNSAKGSGAGVWVFDQPGRSSTVRLRSTTIAGNQADSDANASGSGGGIAVQGGTVSLVDTLVADNADLSGAAPDCYGSLASTGHNLIGDTTGCGFLAQPSDLTDVAAVLGPLAANGGPTATHLPLAGSPAIDAADDARCGVPDQRSFARPVDGNGDTIARCDIGAAEASSATPIVFLSDPFLCYGAAASPQTPLLPDVIGVELADDIETRDFLVRKPKAWCTPLEADGASPADAATHLYARQIRELPGEPRHLKQTGIRITNRLGVFDVDTVRSDQLLVPASSDPATFLPAPDPMAHDLDRYECYKAKSSRTAPKLPTGAAALRVAMANDFSEGRLLRLSKVSRLCTSVDRDGLGRKNPAAHLLCFQARSERPAIPGDSEATLENLHVASEWGDQQLDAKRSYDVCIPSLRLP